MKNLITLYICLLSILLFESETKAQPVGWQNLIPIEITEQSGAMLTDYQLRIEVNTQDLIGIGSMQADGDDIRFGLDLMGNTLLNYWIESGLNTPTTVIWVKVPTLAASAVTTIYLFYGNNSTTGVSNIDGTFIGPHSSTDSVSSGGSGGVGNSQRGFRFSPNEDLLVKRFGKREPTGTTRYVTLFDFSTQAILRQHQVAGAAGQYHYSDLSEPIWLTQGTQYTLQLFQGIGDGYYFGVSSQIGTHLTYYDMRYCNSCSQNSFPNLTLSNYQYGYPDFHYYTKQNISPAPTYVLISCPTFNAAPANVTIVNSTCGSGCALTGGNIFTPTGTPCPVGSTLQYNVNNTGWTTSLPTYDQAGPAQTIRTRCSCDNDANNVSAESIPVTTMPGTLANPSVPANGSSTVACPALATQPTPPAVTGCDGSAIIPTGPTITNDPGSLTCEGTRTYTWTYTCGSTSSIWSYVYTIERNPFAVPANGAGTVACLAAITVPVPPAVNSNCGEPIAPAFVSIVDSPALLTCEGTRTYNYSYTDCEGNTLLWSFVYTIERNPFTVPANGAATVDNPSLATPPTPPAVTSNCGETLMPTGPVVTNNPNPIVCTGTRTYAWTYTDCEGNTAVWSFVYTIINNEPLMAICSNQMVAFNGEESITLNADDLVVVNSDCGVPGISLSPASVSCQQVGQTLPVVITIMDVDNNTTTCTSLITVGGLPCGWSQNPDGVNCNDGNSMAFNAATGVYTATSTGCFYGPPYTSDETAFVQRTLCGNGSITALVTGISPLANGWAGVVMRESNAAGAKKAQLMTNLSTLSRREFRTTTNGQAIPQQFPSQDRYWLRITRSGNQFTMFVSPNGINWFSADAQNIVMSNCIQMGLAATNYTANSTVTATFANVSFTGSNGTLVLPVGEVAQLAPIHSLLEADFEVYPNPTNGELNVDLTQYTGHSIRLEVYGIEGKLLQFKEIGEVQTVLELLDISKLPNGTYLLKIKSAGFPDITNRVVLQKE